MIEAGNLMRWKDSGDPHRWVWSFSGAWCDDEFARLLTNLQTGPFWPMSEGDILATIEAAAKTFHNLKRWNLLGEEGQPPSKADDIFF